MSDVKHTRGPWCVEAVMSNRRNDIVLDYEVPDAGSPILIASAYDDDDDDIAMPGYISPAEAEANARVMAAAPELLALAQKLASECAECNGTGTRHGTIGGDGYGDRCAAIADVEYDCEECADIREVIAKAEGRAS
jgi:hypothetical protein